MAQFKLLNPTLRVVGQKYDLQGKPVGQLNTQVQNAGKKYLYSQLINLNNVWEGTSVYTNFEPNVIAALEPLLPIDKGGTAQAEVPLPEEFTKITGCHVRWVAPQPFYKKHLSAHPANPVKGTPEIHAGDIVKQGGIPVVFTELVVFCHYYLDEFNQKQWSAGRDPESVARQAFSNYCIPISNTQQLHDEINSGTNSESTQTIEQQPQQQQQAPSFTQPQQQPNQSSGPLI